MSRTAILTLITRVVASEKDDAAFSDPMAEICLERLTSIASEEERNWIASRKRFYSGISAHDAKAGAARSKIFDETANRYIAANPQCTVVNLACGFDTRFWRIASGSCRYVEVDLPEVAVLKREVLGDQLRYELVGCSVLENVWIDRVTSGGNTRILLLAEGLLVFLAKADVIRLFQRLAQRFAASRFVCDVVPERYLKGLWRVLIGIETRVNWRLDVSWASGMKDPREIESYASGLKVLGTVKGSAGPIVTVSINAA